MGLSHLQTFTWDLDSLFSVFLIIGIGIFLIVPVCPTYSVLYFLGCVYPTRL